jgi:photosystem II stability/assembly factor-like uncharacterized protein
MRVTTTIQRLRRSDPVDMGEVESFSTHPLFDELFATIVSGTLDESTLSALATLAVVCPVEEISPPDAVRHSGRAWHRPRPKFLLVAFALVALVALLAVTLSVGHGGGGVIRSTTPWRAARVLSSGGSVAPPGGASGSWQLVDDLVSSGWQQNTTGPPPGQLTCPTTTACYALAGAYASPDANAPLLAESLYLSTDLGQAWSVLPMPSGFSPTTPLSCPGALVCSVGGVIGGSSTAMAVTFGGRPVYLTTTDGGHQWTENPFTEGEELISLTCVTADACDAVAAPSSDAALLNGSATHQPPMESFVRTTDAGVHWTALAFVPTDNVETVSCTTELTCVAVGYDQTLTSESGSSIPGFAMSTNDGGIRWQQGRLPANFGFAYPSGVPALALSCVDARTCMALGTRSAPNPDQCVGTGPDAHPPTGATGCSSGPTMLVSGVVTTSDGGATWQLRPLPSDVPIPEMSAVSCASADICWLPGTEAVPQVIGNVHDGGSAVILGTADGGSAWAKVKFTVPPGAANPYGQSYMDVGAISCPTADACLALGISPQGSKTTPVYRYLSVPQP